MRNVSVIYKQNRSKRRPMKRLRQTIVAHQEPRMATVEQALSVAKVRKPRLITVDRYGNMHVNRAVPDSVTRLASAKANKGMGGIGVPIRKRKLKARFSEPVTLPDMETPMVMVGTAKALELRLKVRDKETGEEVWIKVKKPEHPIFKPVGFHSSVPNSQRCNPQQSDD